MFSFKPHVQGGWNNGYDIDIPRGLETKTASKTHIINSFNFLKCNLHSLIKFYLCSAILCLYFVPISNYILQDLCDYSCGTVHRGRCHEHGPKEAAYHRRKVPRRPGQRIVRGGDGLLSRSHRLADRLVCAPGARERLHETAGHAAAAGGGHGAAGEAAAAAGC